MALISTSSDTDRVMVALEAMRSFYVGNTAVLDRQAERYSESFLEFGLGVMLTGLVRCSADPDSVRQAVLTLASPAHEGELIYLTFLLDAAVDRVELSVLPTHDAITPLRHRVLVRACIAASEAVAEEGAMTFTEVLDTIQTDFMDLGLQGVVDF